jgi:serine palmitoyltransferase
MEGDMCPLPTLIHLKRKYKAYLYVDEAHSIGALGATGRGIVEHYGCDPRNIDVLMGTFTKSFASSGGYIGGSLSLINYLKHKSHAHCYASSMCSIVCTKITNILEEFLQLSNNPSDSMLNIRLRLDSLRENTMYFRARLKNLGFCVLGEDKSPVVPCLIHVPSKNM